MIVHNKPFEPFADGIVTVYSVVNIAEEGDRPRDGLRKIISLPYDYKTVGITRYNSGKQDNAKIAAVISVPMRPEISSQNIVKIGETQYSIYQVQRINDTRPPTLKLSLEKVVEDYEFENSEI